ncbi:MAG: HD domain-containing protein [Candidatus Heimdallarchaeota archaeon]
MYSTSQLAKLLALKRGIDPELAGLACAFHDIHSILTGLYRDHGLKAQPHLHSIITEYNEECKSSLLEITNDEEEHLVKAIAGHSDKIAIHADALTELVKDVDSLDAYLHGWTTKAIGGRLPRVRRILGELGIIYGISAD